MRDTKKDALKLQHVGQVKLLLEALDKDGDDITVLGEEQGHAVWSRWVDLQLQSGKKATGTMGTFHSTKKFRKFRVWERMEQTFSRISFRNFEILKFWVYLATLA